MCACVCGGGSVSVKARASMSMIVCVYIALMFLRAYFDLVLHPPCVVAFSFCAEEAVFGARSCHGVVGSQAPAAAASSSVRCASPRFYRGACRSGSSSRPCDRSLRSGASVRARASQAIGSAELAVPVAPVDGAEERDSSRDEGSDSGDSEESESEQLCLLDELWQ